MRPLPKSLSIHEQRKVDAARKRFCFSRILAAHTSHCELERDAEVGEHNYSLEMRRTHQRKSGRSEPKNGGVPRGARRTIDLACDLFLWKLNAGVVSNSDARNVSFVGWPSANR